METGEEWGQLRRAPKLVLPLSSCGPREQGQHPGHVTSALSHTLCSLWLCNSHPWGQGACCRLALTHDCSLLVALQAPPCRAGSSGSDPGGLVMLPRPFHGGA